MIKKIIMLLLTASMLLSLSACSLEELSGITLPPLPGKETAAEAEDPEADEDEAVAEEAIIEPEEAAAAEEASDTPASDPPAVEAEAETEEAQAGPAAGSAEPAERQETAAEQTSPVQAAEIPAAQTVQAAAPPQQQTPAAVPIISIYGETRPSDIQQYRSVELKGEIAADCGVITQVYAVLIDSRGDAVQDCAYYPNTGSFNLAGTVNECLRFGILAPGSYVYQLNASARNGDKTASATLTEVSFNVISPARPSQEPQEEKTGQTSSSSGQYSAKLTEDTSNAGQIWNYLILQLNNPYAAAGILGNINAESSCLPYVVEGDTSKGRSFSISYTENADSGIISRDIFAYSPPGDSLGYGFGLCQWTMERKGNLYDYAKSSGSSLNSIDTQCGFLMQELYASFPGLLEYLKTCTDAKEACRRFCTDYEKASVWGGRTDYAAAYLEKYAKN